MLEDFEHDEVRVLEEEPTWYDERVVDKEWTLDDGTTLYDDDALVEAC